MVRMGWHQLFFYNEREDGKILYIPWASTYLFFAEDFLNSDWIMAQTSQHGFRVSEINGYNFVTRTECCA